MFGLRRKLIIALGSIIALGVLTVGSYFYGRFDERAHCNTKELTATIKGVERHDRIERGITGMDVPALDNGLAGWLRHE